VHEQSRGIVVDLDMDTIKATLVREYTHPEELLCTSQGNVQVLPNGNVFVGWGSEPFFSEYSKDGKLLFDARFAGASRRPGEDPAVAAEKGPKGKVTIYTNWNGVTEVTTWRVLAGAGPGELEPVGFVPREGFETAIEVRTDEPYVAVRAEDDSGRALGTNEAVKPGS
jgi:Arylsulfotransferase (ASST)